MSPILPHQTYVKVRGYHLDGYGHVNNARYLELLEEARWDFSDRFQWVSRLTELGLALVAVNINIDYRRAAIMGEALCIETAMLELGRRSTRLRQRITLAAPDASAAGMTRPAVIAAGAPVVADAQLTFVLLDTKTNKAVAIEGELLRSFADFPCWPTSAVGGT